MVVSQQRACCRLAFEHEFVTQADRDACLAELASQDAASEAEPILLARHLLRPDQWEHLLEHLRFETQSTSLPQVFPRSDPSGSPDSALAVPGAGPMVPGRVWGKFLLERRLGKGGQAEVWQAFDQSGVAGQVALKIPRLRPDSPSVASGGPETRAKLAAAISHWAETEVDPLVRLDHPNIVRVVDAGRVGEVPYVATRLAQGLPLNAHVKTHSPSPRQILGWMIGLADALDCAHRQGIVHHDVKPQNIIVTPEGTPLLIDFGLATLVNAYSPEPQSGSSGTPSFMAPEQARGEPTADHRVDIFGLGGVLKFLLVSDGPYGATTDALDSAREGRVRPITDARGLSFFSGLCRIANRALAADPAARYATAGEMGNALRRLRARRTVLASAAGVAAGLAVLAALLLAFGRGTGHSASGRAATGTVPSPVQATLDIHFHGRSGVPELPLDAASLPLLRTGDSIRIHAKLSQPLAAYLIAVSSNGAWRVLYPSADQPKIVTEIRVPPGDGQYLALDPPPGTETILLVARKEPLRDPEAFVLHLLQLGPPPSLQGLVLLRVDENGPRLIPATRGVGQPAEAKRGFLDFLLRRAPAEWGVVRALAFPHRADEPPGEAKGRSQ